MCYTNPYFCKYKLQFAALYDVLCILVIILISICIQESKRTKMGLSCRRLASLLSFPCLLLYASDEALVKVIASVFPRTCLYVNTN